MRHALVFGYGQKKGGEINDQTKNRCDKAIELYRAGEIEKIYLTVSATKDGHAMADEMKAYLVKAKIPAEVIIVDGRGHNTAGELDIFRSLVPKGEKLVLISTWYHIPRIIWLALWRMSSNRFTTAVAWKHAHFKGDFLVEFAKMANAVFRPIRCSKLDSDSYPFDVIETPSREDIFRAYELRGKSGTAQFVFLTHPSCEDRIIAHVVIAKMVVSGESGEILLIEGTDIGTTGKDRTKVRLRINTKTGKGEIFYL